MGYSITVNDPSFPKGTEFAVGDYFLAKNGEAVEIDDQTAERYRIENDKTMKQGLGKQFDVEVTKTEKFVAPEGSTDSKPEIVVESEPETLATDDVGIADVAEDKGGEN